MMDALVTRIATKVGISEELAAEAVGMMLSYVQRTGDDGAVAAMLRQMPGATEMIARFGGAEIETPAPNSGGGGGLLGSVLGAVSSLTGGDRGGGLMAIGQHLMAQGMEMGQVKQVAEEVFAFAEETVGPEAVERVKKSLPGIGAFL